MRGARTTTMASRLRSCCSSFLSSTPSTPSSSSTFSPSSRRTFSTTPTFAYKDAKKRLDSVLSKIPPYPHAIRHTFKQAWFGLYGGKHIQFGNNVPESNRTRTRRKWHPNVLSKRIWSPALGEYLHTRVTASVLRTIDKVGGLDEYLLGSEKPQRLKDLGPYGWKLRWRLLQTDWAREKFAAQRKEFGLPDAVKTKYLTVDRSKKPLTVEVAGDTKLVSPFADKLADLALVRGRPLSKQATKRGFNADVVTRKVKKGSPQVQTA